MSDLNVRTAKIYLRHSEFVRVSQLGFVLLILLYSGFVADLGVDGVGAIVIILFFLQGHVGLVNAGWQRAVPAWIAYKEISDVVEYLGKLSEQSDRVVPQPENWHEIEFRNACFRYPTLNKSEPAFSVGPLNMSISKGECKRSVLGGSALIVLHFSVIELEDCFESLLTGGDKKTAVGVW